MNQHETSKLEKITGTSPEAKSLDITNHNIDQLKQLFPDVFSEGKIDFEALKALLGEAIDDSNERYNFTWHGKNKARQIAQTPSTGTLRPCKEESVNWDTTENLFIEGDNLEVLKLLQKSYHKKVKMIYIDPPYNTGKDFVYKDNFHDNIQNYLEQTGQVDNDGNRLNTNSDTSGRYHSDWLTMMYPRLKLARNLLTDDGFIFISIDDSEFSNLKAICNEIFGETNFVTAFMWKRKKEISSDSKNISVQGEYILAFSKSDKSILNLEPLSDEYIKKSYKEPTPEFPDGKWRPVPLTVSKGLSGGGYEYTVVAPNGTTHKRLWAYPENSFQKLVDDGLVYYGKDGCGVPQRVMYAHNSKGQPSTNYWDDVTTNKEGKKEIIELFGDNIFDTPKPTKLIRKLINLSVRSGDLVLDFFAGSGTTADAVIRESGTKDINFISVQLPEPTTEKSVAKKNGYNSVSDITKYRIKQALNGTSLGFKVFKLDETNIRPWDANFENLELVLQQAEKSIKEGRTNEDVLYEIFLKYGYDLTTPVETELVQGKAVFVVGAGALFVCLDDDITTETVEGIAKLKEVYDPETTQVVFKDEGFADDRVKTNAIQILKQASIDDVKSI